MKTEARYREGLQQLIKKYPLDEVNVVMLCEHIGSNRQTFYYHFRDISDVVESILLEDRIGYGHKDYDFESIMKTAIAYANAHYSFLSSVNKSFANDKLYQLFYSYFYKAIHQLMKRNKKNNDAESHINSSINRSVSSLFAHELCFWISDKRKEKAHDFVKRLNLIWDYFMYQYPNEITGKE